MMQDGDGTKRYGKGALIYREQRPDGTIENGQFKRQSKPSRYWHWHLPRAAGVAGDGEYSP